MLERLGYLCIATFVHLKYPDTSSNRTISVQNIFSKGGAIRCDILSFSQKCIGYAERRPVTTYNPETEGTCSPYGGSRRKTVRREMEGIKNDYDKKAHLEPPIGVGDEVCSELPHHATCASDSGDAFSRKEDKNCMPGTRRPYMVTDVQSIQESVMKTAY